MENDKTKCNGKTGEDCDNCGAWTSRESIRWVAFIEQKVSTITCPIGGNRYFDKDGEEVY